MSNEKFEKLRALACSSPTQKSATKPCSRCGYMIHNDTQLCPNCPVESAPELFVLTREDIEKAARELWETYRGEFQAPLTRSDRANMAAILFKYAKPAK